ncbi:RNA helicase Mov10l1 [Bagarius yarrelli]|uniref:RNA helicase n=1 Tax=Bagarius yarrelli TaxID=175774 RepID=A0A556THS5_BAGYA|nr:RNA helicase Mov10l1 [Bagarius yarrelli]
MVSAVQFLISKLLSPLWRTVEEEDNGFYYTDAEEIRQMQGGVVTQLCQNYGLIDHSVYFTAGEVLGGMPLHVGFEPVKGDWVKAEYFISPSEWTSQARSVAPLRYQRMDNVFVSSVFGTSGVVGNSVFFSLDSLLLPAGYKPTRGDVVNVVVVESSQSFINGRLTIMPDVEIKTLLENKGGLVVSEETQFGSLLLGESKELLVLLHNTGSETHTLKSCEFAGWDSEKQFWFGLTSSCANNNISSQPEHQQADPYVPFIPNPSTDPIAGHDLGVLPNPSSVPVEERHKKGTNAGMMKLDKEVADDPEENAEKAPRVRAIEKNLAILPGEKVSISVGCQAKNMGRCAELLLLHFSSFTIGRHLEVSVNSVEEKMLNPSVPYCPATLQPTPTMQNHAQVVTITAPAPPVRLARRHLPNFLGSYPMPQALRDCMEAKADVLVVQPALGEPLSLSNMLPRFSALLWLEELQAEKELREFSINGALLKKGAGYLHLAVPGLSEGRPSLYIGDKVVLKKPCSQGFVVEYITYVTKISEEDVSLRVNAELLNSYLGEPLDVEFTYNRLPMRRCHCALEQTKHFGENVLFPRNLQLQSPLWSGDWEPELLPKQDKNKPTVEGETCKENPCVNSGKPSFLTTDMVSVATQTKTDLGTAAKINPEPGKFFNCNLNPAQKEAVKRILSGECRPTPYVLFGPPGTGKTITLIEAILQVYYHVPGSRVLVCTPSNSAADLICIRLHESGYLQAASMARVNATCRIEEYVPEVLRQYSHAGEDVRHASFHRIVVSTCSSAGMFYQIGLRVGHFTHVFLDEAGQATEPETLIPLGLLFEKTGQIVLAGDPKQLGPVVKSKLAEAFGLGVSLLERLMASPLYSLTDEGYNRLLVTKLVYNYRSHEVLLELPSRLFYNGELCVRSQRSVVDSLCHWSRLPTKGFPLIFHGVRGTEMREGTNPSWFNPGEAVQAMLYCSQLVKRLYNPIPATDIGIITPYKKQVEKIRVLLNRTGLTDIKVGSVEEFQGQEFLVIILSTVRSNEAITSSDVQSALGFLSNPKRFNVAITRPKALLIIIGNPHVLIKVPLLTAVYTNLSQGSKGAIETGAGVSELEISTLRDWETGRRHIAA